MSDEKEYLHDIFHTLHEAWWKLDATYEQARDAGDRDLASEILDHRYALTKLTSNVLYRMYPDIREKIEARIATG